MKFNYLNLLALKNGDGATLKNYECVTYRSGWQVATDGILTSRAATAWKAIKEMNGTCGVWYENGSYYIDRSLRTSTKKEAMEIGRANNQISIYGWKLGRLAYC